MTKTEKYALGAGIAAVAAVFLWPHIKENVVQPSVTVGPPTVTPKNGGGWSQRQAPTRQMSIGDAYDTSHLPHGGRY